MSMLSVVATRFDDAMNPIVVKELRQAVKGRFLSAMLTLFLIVQLVALGVAIMIIDDVQSDFGAGRAVCTTMLVILSLTCMLFIPINTGVRLAFERSDGHPC